MDLNAGLVISCAEQAPIPPDRTAMPSVLVAQLKESRQMLLKLRLSSPATDPTRSVKGGLIHTPLLDVYCTTSSILVMPGAC